MHEGNQMNLTDSQFEKLKNYAFSADNRGFNPHIQEAPNGDGNWDNLKLYAHVAPKYGLGNVAEIYLETVRKAQEACENIGVPGRFWPSITGDCTIRILKYPAGATSAPHTDFDLATLRLYRKDPGPFRYISGECDALARAREMYPGIHFGELMTEITGEPATEHEVTATNVETYSAVLFVMPPLDETLPSGLTVRRWLEERKARSRRVAAEK